MEKFIVEYIPAVLLGEPSDKIYIYVHGKQGYKEYAEAFAKVAEEKGYQTLSFDLPIWGLKMQLSWVSGWRRQYKTVSDCHGSPPRHQHKLCWNNI